MLTHHFSKKALSSLKGHSASMKCVKLYNFKISSFSTILDWKLQWFGWEKYCADHKYGVFTPFQCEFLQNISDLIIFNIKWSNVGVGFKKYAKFKKIWNLHPKKWETCLIWSFSAKMDQCTDVSHLSWSWLMLEIKHKKALLTCLKSTKICDLVYRQWLHHCMEQLVILEREEEQRWMEAALRCSCLRPCPPAWLLQDGTPSHLTRTTPWPGPYTGPPIIKRYVTFLSSCWPYFTS